MVKISAIAAVSENNVIGNNGGLPWHLPDDLLFFRQMTIKHSILMGRKTYEGILQKTKKPLDLRHNIVLSSTSLNYKGIHVVKTLNEAIQKAQALKSTELFVIGGQQVFELCLPKIDTLYLTRVHVIAEGDTYFPWWSLTGTWKETFHQHRSADHKNKFARSISVYEKVT